MEPIGFPEKRNDSRRKKNEYYIPRPLPAQLVPLMPACPCLIVLVRRTIREEQQMPKKQSKRRRREHNNRNNNERLSNGSDGSGACDVGKDYQGDR
mmetsp:Transcript_33180/g.56376  ORF Transcript_33180/g.56376 Transcript_33180/m.56376 type:complete len:96 (+) Transcript_33180:181-468(+)